MLDPLRASSAAPSDGSHSLSPLSPPTIYTPPHAHTKPAQELQEQQRSAKLVHPLVRSREEEFPISLCIVLVFFSYVIRKQGSVRLLKMNSALDTPLEALAIDCVRFGLFTVVSNLWTWVTVLTAALSFWRIRASPFAARAAPTVRCPSAPDPQPPLREDASSSACRTSSVSDEKPCPSQRTSASHATAASSHPLVAASGDYGVTKGRFTVYYDDDRETDDNEMEELVAATGSERVGGGNYGSGLDWWGGWAMALKVRNGDSGWYRYQDRAVLDGSVVRLWDDHKGLVRRLGH